MRTLKLTIEYDGTDFVGWQRQSEGVSIQGLVEEGLSAFEGGPVTVHGAGRTDAGVHALGQVASVTLTASHAPRAIQRGLNAVLPPAVRVRSVEDVPSGFHARFSATSKTYEYRIVNASFVSPFLQRYVWHVPGSLNLELMRQGAAALAGTHDFAAFQGAGTTVPCTVRTIYEIEWVRPGSADAPLVLRIRGDGFLRHMVRNIVGTLADAGFERPGRESVPDILASRDRARAGSTAPAAGLFLVAVDYAGPSSGLSRP